MSLSTSSSFVTAALLIVMLLHEGVFGQVNSTVAANTTEIRQLLQERCDVLRQACEVAHLQYQGGVTDFGRVQQLQYHWISSALDMAQTPAETIELLTSQLHTADAIMQSAQSHFETGRVSQLDVLQAKAVVLRAQIELARAREKLAAPSTPAVCTTAATSPALLPWEAPGEKGGRRILRRQGRQPDKEERHNPVRPLSPRPPRAPLVRVGKGSGGSGVAHHLMHRTSRARGGLALGSLFA